MGTNRKAARRLRAIMSSIMRRRRRLSWPSENLLFEGLDSASPRSSQTGGGRYHLSPNAAPAASFNSASMRPHTTTERTAGFCPAISQKPSRFTRSKMPDFAIREISIMKFGAERQVLLGGLDCPRVSGQVKVVAPHFDLAISHLEYTAAGQVHTSVANLSAVKAFGDYNVAAADDS